MNTADRVLAKTRTDGRGENFTVTVAKRQGPWEHAVLVVHSGGLKHKHRPVGSRELDISSFHNLFLSVQNGSNATITSVDAVEKTIANRSRFFFGCYRGVEIFSDSSPQDIHRSSLRKIENGHARKVLTNVVLRLKIIWRQKSGRHGDPLRQLQRGA